MGITAELDAWIGRPLLDDQGRRLGTIEEMYRHAQTGRPQWVVVKLGRIRSRRCFVPLNDARRTFDGIVTPHDLGTIAAAPRADLGDQLVDDQLIALYRHYGLPHDTLVDEAAPEVPPSPRDRVLGYLKDS